MTDQRVSAVLSGYAHRSVARDKAILEGKEDDPRVSQGVQVYSRSQLLKRIGTISLHGPPIGAVEVRMVAQQYNPPRSELTSLPERKGALFLTMDTLKDRVCKTFGWKTCRIETTDTQEINAAEDIAMAWNSYQISESSRKRDALEAVLESIRAAFSSEEVELHFQACHALWELSCDQNNHKYMTFSLFEGLHAAIRSPELRVRGLATATVWKLAEFEYTVERMPVALFIPCLLKGLFAERVSEPSDEVADEAAQTAAMAAEASGSVMFCEKIMCQDSASRLALEEVDEDAERELMAARAVAGTGYSLIEQRVWQAGALLSCTSTDSGLKVFHKSGFALRLLPMLEASADESPPPLKAACAALLSQVASHSNVVCKAMLLGGASCLVRLAGGFSGGSIHLHTRMQAADLLKYALTRSRLSPNRERDFELLKNLPKLIGELRAASKPLMNAIRLHIAAADEGKDPTHGRAAADDAALLMKSIAGVIWGMVSALRLANRVILAGPGLLTILRKLLELAPEREEFANASAERIMRAHGKSFRTYALGIISCVSFGGTIPVSPLTEAMRLSEEAAFEKACKRLGTGDDDEPDEKSKAAEILQAQRRGMVARREADQKELPAHMRRRRPSLQSTMLEMPEEEEIFGPIQGRQLKVLRQLAQELLGQLERTVGKSQTASRVTECYAAALSSMAPLTVNALLNVHSIDRVLALCEQMKKVSFGDVLAGCAVKVHGYLLSSLLACLSKGHPGLATTKTSSSSRAAYRGGVRLAPKQLKTLINQMQSSQSGGKIGAAVLWLQACLGSNDLIGELGGTEVLCG